MPQSPGREAQGHRRDRLGSQRRWRPTFRPWPRPAARLRGDHVERPVRAGGNAARRSWISSRRRRPRRSRRRDLQSKIKIQWRRSDRHGSEGVSGLLCKRTSADGPTRSAPPASSRNSSSAWRHGRVTTESETAETLADRKTVEEGYAFVNAMWKTQGAVATLRYVHHLPHGRALAARVRSGGARSRHRELRQLLSRRLPRLADAVVQGRRSVSRARSQGAGGRPPQDRGADAAVGGRLLSSRRLHASRHRPSAARDQAFDAASGGDLLGGGAAVLAAVVPSKCPTTIRSCVRSCGCRAASSGRPA